MSKCEWRFGFFGSAHSSQNGQSFKFASKFARVTHVTFLEYECALSYTQPNSNTTLQLKHVPMLVNPPFDCNCYWKLVLDHHDKRLLSILVFKHQTSCECQTYCLMFQHQPTVSTDFGVWAPDFALLWNLVLEHQDEHKSVFQHQPSVSTNFSAQAPGSK